MPLRYVYALSLPERCIRAFFAGAGGALSEGSQLLLPRFVRRSRFYEATAKNALRIAVELIGGVAPPPGVTHDVTAGRIAAKKAAGNVVELGSIAAFGFSPLWLLAAASDVLNGTRTYLRTLEDELAAAGLLPADVRFESLDHLMAALEGTAGGGARFIDLPPLELAELRRSVQELRADVDALPTHQEMAALFNGLVRMAHAERRSVLEISSGLGLAFLASAKRVGRDGVLTPYHEDWAPLREEGLIPYLVRTGRPYGQAAAGHFDPARTTLTERLPAYGRRTIGWLRDRGHSDRSGTR
ncbi:MAG: hypothetical protein WD734_06950 [Dehalococcoidia bacterium]